MCRSPASWRRAGLESELVQTATAAGLTVVTLSDWAEGYAPSAVKLGDADHHPNALGQRLIARRLLEEVSRRPELIRGRPRDVP